MQSTAHKLALEMTEKPPKSTRRGALVLGRAVAEKLCAVENVSFAADADVRSQMYTKQGLSPSQRRQAIIQHYKAIA